LPVEGLDQLLKALRGGGDDFGQVADRGARLVAVEIDGGLGGESGQGEEEVQRVVQVAFLFFVALSLELRKEERHFCQEFQGSRAVFANHD